MCWCLIGKWYKQFYLLNDVSYTMRSRQNDIKKIIIKYKTQVQVEIKAGKIKFKYFTHPFNIFTLCHFKSQSCFQVTC